VSEVELRLDLDWAGDGDEWLTQLATLLPFGNSEIFGGDSDEVFDNIQITASDPRLLSVLWVARGEDGRIECTIVDDDDPLAGIEERFPDQIGPWREAILKAAARVGALPAATWNVLLGPRPQPRTGGSLTGADTGPIALAGETIVGPVRLVPGGVFMHEMPDARADRIGQDRYPYSSWPLIVEGTAASHGEYPDAPEQWWPMDERTALLAAHRVAALVCLVWGECWIVRQEPVRITPGARITVPHLPDGHDQGTTPWAQGCTTPPQQEAAQRRDLELPVSGRGLGRARR
jgi:hypothetical protein